MELLAQDRCQRVPFATSSLPLLIYTLIVMKATTFWTHLPNQARHLIHHNTANQKKLEKMRPLTNLLFALNQISATNNTSRAWRIIETWNILPKKTWCFAEFFCQSTVQSVVPLSSTWAEMSLGEKSKVKKPNEIVIKRRPSRKAKHKK